MCKRIILRTLNRQKQPLEVLCKKSCSQKVLKFHRKTLGVSLEAYGPAALLKRDSDTGVFL